MKGLKGLEESLNLPKLEDVLKEIKDNQEDGDEIIEDNVDKLDYQKVKDMLNNPEVLNKKLKMLNDENFTENEDKLNEIQKMAIESYRDLMEAGLNVEARSASGFTTPAAQFLTIAQNVEMAKMERKYRLMKLKLDKQIIDQNDVKLLQADRKLDLEEKKLEKKHTVITQETQPNAETNTLNLDRNDLIRTLVKTLDKQ